MKIKWYNNSFWSKPGKGERENKFHFGELRSNAESHLFLADPRYRGPVLSLLSLKWKAWSAMTHWPLSIITQSFTRKWWFFFVFCTDYLEISGHQNLYTMFKFLGIRLMKMFCLLPHQWVKYIPAVIFQGKCFLYPPCPSPHHSTSSLLFSEIILYILYDTNH